MNSISELEATLARGAGRKHCIFTGRASTALYLSLSTITERRGAVVLPSITCLSPANAARMAGHTPVFCDVSDDDFGMSPDALEEILRERDDVVAVVAIHLFGAPCRVDRICEVAARHGVPVIEDAAQALGAEYDGVRVGGFGAVSILSFGHTKIIDCGRGGALLTDDDGLAERARALDAVLPGVPNDLAARFADYRASYYAMTELAGRHPRLSSLLPRLPEVYSEMYLFRGDGDVALRIVNELPLLNERIARRRNRVAQYAAAIEGLPAVAQRDRGKASPWRFTFFVTEGDARVAGDRIRERGFNASHWYPALHRLSPEMPGDSASACPNAERLGQSVINLWVDETVSDEFIERTCAALPECLRAG